MCRHHDDESATTLVELADCLAGIRERTGRSRADVVT
jgi:hypothetical protein